MRKYSRMKYVLTFLLVLISLPIWTSAAYADQFVTANRINLGIAGEEEFMAGYVMVPRLPVFWESDVPWRLTVSSFSPDLGLSDDASYIKPLEDLQWKISEEQVWLPLSQDAEEVIWGTETGSGVIYIDVMVQLDWLEDTPGDYHADIILTIEAM